MATRNDKGQRIATKNGIPCRMVSLGEVDGVEIQVNTFESKEYSKYSKDYFTQLARRRKNYYDTKERLLAKLEAKRCAIKV